MKKKQEFILTITKYNYDGFCYHSRREQGTLKKLFKLVEFNVIDLEVLSKDKIVLEPINGIYVTVDYSCYIGLLFIDTDTRTMGDHS